MRPRIVHLTTSFPLDAKAPGGVFVYRLVKSLAGIAEQTVLVPAPDHAVAPPPAAWEVDCFRYAATRWQRLAHDPGGIPVALARQPLLYLLLPGFLLAMLFASARALRRAELIHAHWSVNGVIGGLAARVMGRKAVTTLWGEDVTRAATSRLFRALLWLAIALSHRTVSVSAAMHRAMVRAFPRFEDRLLHIPNGVEDAWLEVAQVPAAQGAPAGLRLLTVGSLIPRKGIDRIVAAVEALKDAAAVRLVVVGQGAEEARLRELAQRGGIADRVEFAGQVPPERIARHYAAADVFVLASYSEGMPSVILEAMSIGLPIVATDIDGVRELIEPGVNGLLFAPGDTRALSAHLSALARDPGLRARLGAGARRTIVERGLTWSEIGRRYGALYGSLGAAP